MKYIATVKNVTDDKLICTAQLSDNDVKWAFPRGFIKIGDTYIWFPDNMRLEEVLNYGFSTTWNVRGQYISEISISIISE